jgi:iron complex outermembrane receptor protein
MNFLRKTKAERRTRKSIFSATSALISAAAAAALLPQAALAQTQPVPDQSQPGATEQAEEEEDDEAITVTGTRIRSEFNSSSPLQVITTEAATLSGANDAGEIIQNSSVAAGSPQVDATISSAFVTDGGPGAQTISLRGLGANRTLVLLNGRRAGPAGTRGSVSAFDLNVVPVGVIDRIEILKDGASSIYGSDAVAGVVNIITGRDLDGGDATIAYSQPFEDGAAELSGEVSWGHAFPQGHINLSANYYHQEETLLGQRDYTACARDYTFDSVTGARNDRIDLRTGEFACTGHAATGLVWLYDYAYFYAEGSLQNGFGPNFIQPDPSGDIGTLLPGTVVSPANPFQAGVPNNWFQVGYDNDVQSQGLVNTFPAGEQNSSLIPDVERATIYADGAYEIGGAELYGEVLLNRRETATNGFRQVWTYLYSYDFFTHLGGPIVTDEFNPGWTGFNTISPTVTTDHFDAHQQVDYVRAVAGLRGDFGGPLGNVDWDIFIQHSVSDASYTQDVILADAVYSSDGRSNYGTVGLIQPNSIPRDTASCVGFNTPISNRPCVDVNWVAESLLLGNGFTPEEEAFLYDRETGNT